MILSDYINANSESIAMIALVCENTDSSEDKYFQYNYWSWNKNQNTLFLLKNCYRVGHVLMFTEHDTVEKKEEDNSFLVTSNNHPKSYRLDFYLGGAKL